MIQKNSIAGKENYKILYLASRKKWRKWLETNWDKEKEIWLVFPKKSSGKPRMRYNDAVEEALCFGWIDSTVKALDEEKTIQRFLPRNPTSKYSQSNKERLKWLSSEKMLHPSIQDAVEDVLKEKFVFPADILNAIETDKKAWENYSKFSDAYKRIRIAYIDTARKRPQEFRKRLTNFIKKTRENKQIGYGGIEKYY
jgi:uncharacterized protein YdeI (YjbR/CyaY-like superfamily)